MGVRLTMLILMMAIQTMTKIEDIDQGSMQLIPHTNIWCKKLNAQLSF